MREPSIAQACITLILQSVVVIDHDCRGYLTRYCDRSALRTYMTAFEGDPAPWDLIGLVVALGPPSQPEWEGFIVDDMKAKLGRFAEIIIDPSVVE